jgi:hypothetical protein
VRFPLRSLGVVSSCMSKPALRLFSKEKERRRVRPAHFSNTLSPVPVWRVSPRPEAGTALLFAFYRRAHPRRCYTTESICRTKRRNSDLHVNLKAIHAVASSQKLRAVRGTLLSNGLNTGQVKLTRPARSDAALTRRCVTRHIPK